MADPITNGDAEEELVDYDEDEGGEEAKTTTKAADQAKAGYVGIHSSGFKDFLLKPELLRAIVDCGFEHPSEGNAFFCERYSNDIYTSSFSLEKRSISAR